MPRRLLIIALLIIALFLERAAHFGARAMLFQQLESHGDPDAAIDALGHFMSIATVGGAFAPLLGGLVAIAAGPRMTALLGLLSCAAGHALAAAHVLTAAAVIETIGVGLFAPAAIAAIASELGHPRDNARLVVLAFAFLAIDVGAFFSSVTAPLVGAGGAVGFVIASAAALLAAGLVAAAAMRARGREVDLPTFARRPEAGVAVLFCLALPLYAGAGLYGAIQDALPATSREESAFVLVSGVAGVLAGVVVAVGAGLAAGIGAAPVFARAFGATIVASALALALAASSSPDAATELAAPSVILAFTTPALSILFASRAAADVQPRFATLVYAAVTTAAMAAGFTAYIPVGPEMRRLLLGVFAALSLGSGCFVILRSGWIRSRWFTPRPPSVG